MNLGKMSLNVVENCTIEKLRFGFPFAWLSRTVSELKRDIGRKSRFFHTPPAFDAPVRGSPSEYCHNVWHGQLATRRRKMFDDMFSRLDTIPACDRRTDGQIDILINCDNIVALCIASHGENCNNAVAGMRSNPRRVILSEGGYMVTS